MDVGIDETFEPWASKRTSILSTYTTSQRIPITTSFLPSEEREKREVPQNNYITNFPPFSLSLCCQWKQRPRQPLETRSVFPHSSLCHVTVM